MTHPPSAAASACDPRREALVHWLACLGYPATDLQPASGDASSRRYFRFSDGPRTLIAMDAPPQQEDCVPFLQVQGLLQRAGVNVPAVRAVDLEDGFLLLTDLGRESYLGALRADNADALYGDALDTLARAQHGLHHDALDALPPYDAPLLRREMDLFRDWLLARHLGLSLSSREQQLWEQACAALVDAALEQPRGFVHRDYHSRNLMHLPGAANPGVLDFQDAVCGPLTYDLVSLLRDCYIAWPDSRVQRWALEFLALPGTAEVAGQPSAERWLRWFDLMGVQRHLKASGIFARLWLRDGKPGYLADIPRTLGYIAAVGARHAETRSLAALVQERVLPALPACPPEARPCAP